MNNIAVCLVSGGLDSCVAATLAKQAGDELYFLSIDWGQTSIRELENAHQIADILQPKEHLMLDLKAYRNLSQSALTGYSDIPTTGTLSSDTTSIPTNYPPGRDPSFIMIGSSWLESIMLSYLSEGENVDSGKVIIGTNKEDSQVFPDCNPQVYDLLNRMFRLSTKIGREHEIPFEVTTPLLDLTKKDVVKTGFEIGAPIEHTRSCYKSEDLLCGECNPCKIIYFAFEDLQIENPFTYSSTPTRRYSRAPT